MELVVHDYHGRPTPCMVAMDVAREKPSTTVVSLVNSSKTVVQV